MTNIQKAFCVVLSLIFLCVVAALQGDFFKHGEIYRQLPLYCFLEKKALQEENGQDRETEMLLQEKNAEHLGEEVEAENRKELYEGLRRISEREQVYLLYRFGFEDDMEHPLVGTALHFHLSESRARSTEALALDNLWLELPWWY